MIGHKTSGDWTDVTSFNRNEIVFEGRNKEYGAYVIRQEYNNSLLIALLIASSLGILVVAVPLVIRLLSPNKLVDVTTITEVIKPRIIDIINPPPVAPPSKPIIPPPPSTSRVFPPRIDKNDSLTIIPEHKDTTQGLGVSMAPGAGVITAGLGVPTGGETGTIPVEKKSEPLIFVSEMPKFNGLEEYIGNHIQYPQIEMQEGIEGTVNVSFVVEEDGSLSDIKVLHGISGAPAYSDAAIEVLKGMPNWIPGKQSGHNVRVRLSLPIHIILK